MTSKETLRGLPAVHRFLSEEALAPYEALLGRESVKGAIEAELARARAADIPPYDHLLQAVCERLDRERMASLVGVVNGTGVLLHTNLGRAPLAPEALAAAEPVALGYSNLEFDLETGERGSRYARVTALSRAATGAAEALVVNNCAAAVLLVLDTFAKGREVVVSRNQLIEIGGGFRIPDVLERSGATLVEVGATNKVYLRDYERALSPRTALLLRSHSSNFTMSGFTHDVEPAQLAALGKRTGIPVIEDLGSGALVDLTEYGLPHERTVLEAVADGIDLVAFSGDKLLGGPQAGVIVGAAPLIARLRSNPLLRALRLDKVTLALLAQTLRLYRSREMREHLPFYRMLAYSCDALRERAQAYVTALPSGSVRVVASAAFVGGGSLPHARIDSVALDVRPSNDGVDALAARLRRGDPAIVGRIEDGRFLLDLRTIAPAEDARTIEALRAAR